MRWIRIVTSSLVVAYSSSTENPGAGGAASGGPGGGGGSDGGVSCAQCKNQYSNQFSAFAAAVNGCHVGCCDKCSCAGGIEPSMECIDCVKGSACIKSDCSAGGCKDLVDCLSGCGAF